MPRFCLFALLIVVAGGRIASAGMPSIRVAEAAAWRLEALSFFAVVFFLSAWGVKGLWNYLAGEFAWPHLNYARALALTTLWALLFVLVLTMISGARELMTPGAWERDGSTYKLKSASGERSAR